MTQKPRILFVDDEIDILSSFKHNLRQKYEVVTAESGAEGIDTMRGQPAFAVVVSDMRMPGMDGATFLARARQISDATTRILLTGHTDLDAAINAVNDGFIFRFLTKPCPHEVLLDALGHGVIQYRRLSQSTKGSDRNMTQESDSGKIELDYLRTLCSVARGVGHEINNMTTVLDSLIPHIQERSAKGLAPEQDYVTELLHLATHLRSHGQHLLTMGMPSSDEAHEPCSVQMSINKMLQTLRLSGMMKDVVVVMPELDPRLCTSMRDTHLEQIIINLLLNAVHAFAAASVASPKLTILFSRSADGKRLSLHVKDNAAGMAPDVLERIFEEHFTTKGQAGGSGQGLAIVKKIIEDYKGNIEARSLPGKGTTFTFDLPIA
jgi:signal transduction histidine kinase